MLIQSAPLNPTRSPSPAACANCGAALSGPFCAACGQEARTLDPTLRELTRDLFQEFVDVDGRLLRSIRALFLSPGLLTREQFLGRRVRWVTPLRLYLTFSVAYFAVVAMGGSDLRVEISGPEAYQAGRLKEMGYANVEQLRLAFNQSLAVWMPRINFALVPLFAALVALVRRGGGRRYPQHLIFALHAHAAWFGARALAGLGALTKIPSAGAALNALTFVFGLIYVARAFHVAYGVSARRAAVDAATVLGVYAACVIGAVLAVLFPYLRALMSIGR